jgi:hypothetical protein
MATFNQRDIELLFVGDSPVAITTGGIDTLNVGEIGIFTPAGTRMTEALAATEDAFIIVQDRGTNPPLVSGIIKKADVAKAKAKLFAAATEQVDVIGFNGTSGSIEIFNDNLYYSSVNLRQHLTSNHGGIYVKHGVYKSSSSATEAEIAAGLHASFVANFSREPDRLIRFERLYSDATLATTTAETYAINTGSRFSQASAAPTVSVGDAIRFTTNTASTATYRVVAVDLVNDIIEIDVAYQGVSIAAPGNTVHHEAVIAGNNWGVRLTGLALPFTVGKKHYGKVAWDLTLDTNASSSQPGTFGATTQSQLAAATAGSGTEFQIRELEWFAQGNEGDFYRMGEPNIFPSRTDVSTGDTYDMITLTIAELYKGSMVSGPINKVYTLAIPSSTPAYASGGSADDITDVLEVLIFGSATGALAV